MAAQYSIFPGCTAHSTGIEYNMSMRDVMAKLGVEFTEIDDWNCCGAAAAHCLSKLLGLALPARNVAKAQEIDLPAFNGTASTITIKIGDTCYVDDNDSCTSNSSGTSVKCE